MKKTGILLLFLAIFFAGCENDPIKYKGAAFISFTTTEQVVDVRENADNFIPVGVSKPLNEDKTYTVRIDSITPIKGGSVVGEENVEFTIDHSVTIPAGEYIGQLKIKGDYSKLDPDGFNIYLSLTDVEDEFVQEGIEPAGRLQTCVTLRRFFEITEEWLEGTWDCYDFQYGSPAGGRSVTIEGLGGGKIKITNFFADGVEIIASIDNINRQIAISPGQKVTEEHSIYYMPSPSTYNSTAIIPGPVYYKGQITIGMYCAITPALRGYLGLESILVADRD